MEIDPFLSRPLFKLPDILFVRCSVGGSIDASAKFNRDEASLVVFDRSGLLDDQWQHRSESVGRWSLLGDSCGKHLLLVFVDLDPTDEISEWRYVTSLSSK